MKVADKAALLREHRIFNAHGFVRRTGSVALAHRASMGVDAGGWEAFSLKPDNTIRVGKFPYSYRMRESRSRVIREASAMFGIHDWVPFPGSRADYVSAAALAALIATLEKP